MEQKELKRRIAAALRYAGLNQAELGLLFKEDGLGKEDPGKIQRGKMALRQSRLDAFVKHTGLPEAWFTEPDLNRVLATPGSEGAGEWSDSVLSDAALAAALAELAEAQQQLQHAQELLRRGEQPEGSTGNG